ncbi:unnamed protein product [Tilletia controversa]|nr:unnamed protein product [Tilletia controversa]CAD6931852.1 unnamed protein product [Tilletia controversa]CAD6983120.1 unnamed protein product [Tilletia controversa]
MASTGSAAGEKAPASLLQSWISRFRKAKGQDDAEEEEPQDDRPDPSFQNAFTRRAIVAALWTGVVLSVPLWWKTTTIVRLPLPEAELSSWTERGACPIRIPTSLRIHLPGNAASSQLYNAEPDFLEHLRRSLVRDLDEASGRHAPSSDKSVSSDAPSAAKDDSCIDWSVTFDGVEESSAPASIQAFGYDVVLGASAKGSKPSASIFLNISSTGSAPESLASGIASQLSSAFNLPLRTLPIADTRAIQYSRPLRLVFSLLNEDVTRGGAVDGWELTQALRDSELQSLVESLGGVHDVLVESQVLWYAPLAFQPTREDQVHILEQSGDCSVTDQADADEVDSLLQDAPPPKESSCVIKSRTDSRFFVEWEDLKVFVNAAAWSLTSAVSSLRQVASVSTLGLANTTTFVPSLVEEEEKTIHLLLYLPAADQRPLLVRDPKTGNASQAHAWMVPQWGGVVLLNLPASDDTSAKKGQVGPVLRAEDLQEPIRLWTNQLRTLLGLRSESGSSVPFCTQSELGETCIPRTLPADLLAIRRIVESTRDAVATLQSTVRLVHKISNLGVGTEVKGDVEGALELLTQLDRSLQGAPASIPVLSRQASPSQAHAYLQHALSLASLSSTLASRAFFHPSMLGLLYFPEEHKYAVYTPLFGPVAVPLLVALVRELKDWRKARRRSREAEKTKTE